MHLPWHKRAVTLLLAFTLAVGLCPSAAFADGETDSGGNAGTTYSGTQSITLDQDVAGIVIAAGADVTIDLNGHSISATAASTQGSLGHAITNYGRLTIKGEGTVDGLAYAGAAAVYTAPGALTVLNGGAYTGSKWYVIKNLGITVINDGVTVTQLDQKTSAIDNGYYGNSGANDCWLTADGTNWPNLTVNGGTFTAGGASKIFQSLHQENNYGGYKICGGSFNADPTSYPKVSLADDYSLTKDEASGEWTVAKSKVVVTFMNGTRQYAQVEAEKGQTVAAPADPTLSGSTFTGWATEDGTVIDLSTYAFESDTTLYAVWEQNPTPASHFSDVVPGSWYASSVSYVYKKGLMTGYEGTKIFGVGNTLTRAELATILWRRACADEAASYDQAAAVDTTGIANVGNGMYYTAAANWAVANGVVTGYQLADGSCDFAPNDPVTLEQFVTIVGRFSQGSALPATGDLSAFVDGASVSAWAQGAVAWAGDAGMIKGYDTASGKCIGAADDVMRERAATILARAIKGKLI